MLGFLSKILGGNKSEKDVKQIEPIILKINEYFQQYQHLSHDALRGKTAEFRKRIAEYLTPVDTQILSKQQEADNLPEAEMQSRDFIYQEVDKLKKERDKKIEEILEEILPEAFAVVKETANRFKNNPEITATATELDRNLSVKKDYITIEGDQVTF